MKSRAAEMTHEQYKKYLASCYKIARKYNLGNNLEDAVAVGMMRVVENMTEGRGQDKSKAEFDTYVYRSMSTAIHDYVQTIYKSGLEYHDTHASEFLFGSDEREDIDLDKQHNLQALEMAREWIADGRFAVKMDIPDSLCKEYHMILEYRYFAENPISLTEIGKQIGKSAAMISITHLKMLKDLKEFFGFIDPEYSYVDEPNIPEIELF